MLLHTPFTSRISAPTPMKSSRLLFLPLLVAPLFFGFSPAVAEINEPDVEAAVKNAPCREQTIEDALKNKIHIRSQRDLGWRIFNEDGHFEAERAFLVNKSMQLRFRWRLNEDGSITPVSKRAETLCTEED